MFLDFRESFLRDQKIGARPPMSALQRGGKKHERDARCVNGAAEGGESVQSGRERADDRQVKFAAGEERRVDFEALVYDDALLFWTSWYQR
jgi:hypothetical protein